MWVHLGIVGHTPLPLDPLSLGNAVFGHGQKCMRHEGGSRSHSKLAEPQIAPSKQVDPTRPRGGLRPKVPSGSGLPSTSLPEEF